VTLLADPYHAAGKNHVGTAALGSAGAPLVRNLLDCSVISSRRKILAD